MLDKIKKYNPITVLVHHIQLERRVRGLYNEYGKDKILESEIEGSSDGREFIGLLCFIVGFALCMIFSEFVMRIGGLKDSSVYNFISYSSLIVCYAGLYALILYENRIQESKIRLYECKLGTV